MQRYRSAWRAPQAQFLGDLVHAAYAGVLVRELTLERNRLRTGGHGARHLLHEAHHSGAHFAHYGGRPARGRWST